jgi:hypothetical protein
MINPFADINWKPDERELRKFGRSLVIGGPILAAVFAGLRLAVPAYAGRCGVIAAIFAGAALAGCFALALPRWSRPVYLVWYFLAACIGTVISNVLLLAFYYLFFTPFALVMRATGRDALALKRRDRPTLWVPHRQPESAARYYRQY